jgi:SGNH hydrolase-like domain, acetyltransferase AlgX
MKISIKNALILTPLVFFVTLWWQKAKPYYYVIPLAAVAPAPSAKPTLKTWWDGSFQEKYNAYINDNFGFRPEFVRWWREMDFRVFKQVNSGDIVVGKNDNLLGGAYINAYFGKNHHSEQAIKEWVLKLKKLSENLAKQGKTFVVIMAADKSSFYPELIPNNHILKKSITDQQLFELYATEAHLPYLNFRNYINSLKGKTPYPLFPQTGVHWSEYCGSIVLDSITKYISAQRNIQVPRPKIDRFDLSNQPKGKDLDLEWIANLKYPMHLSEPLAYPVYTQTDTIGKTKPSVLAIGDSYYWTIYDQKIGKQLFKQHIYISYDKTYCMNDSYNEKQIKDMDLRKTINDSDVIFIMATSTNLHQIGWGNVDSINSLYKQ